MKEYILLLLLATFSIQAQTLQNPTYGNVKLKNNTTDNSATKVNVQSTDGAINTISKSDLVNVVEVNDVPTLPLVGEVGKIYVVKNVNKIYRWNGTFYQELSVTDISGKEDVANKATDFTTVNNTLYPSLQAVSNQILESNKKWVLFGDSISNTLLDPDYPFYVIENLKLTGTVTNAVAGNTSADQLTILNSILTSTPTYFNSFDIASLLVGVNDWATNVPLGNRQSLITDTNFAGRVKAIIEKIITAKPSIRLYVMTPFETNSVAAPYNSFNTAGYTLREMSVLISQICSDYSVQCIDLYSLSQLNLKTIPTFLSDGVHPNSIGAKFIGDIVSKSFLSNNNKGKLVDTGIKRKREDLYEEVENNIYKIQKGSFQPSTIYDSNHNVGIGKSLPIIKLEVVSKTVDPTPVLGSGAKGFVSFLSNNLLYGEYIGSSNTGDIWHQIQRNDGNTSTYNMLLQPLGGNVIIGSLSDNGSRLQVTGNITATSFNGSATLTGTPTAPTAPAGTNTTQIATTAFVAGGLANKENSFTKNTAFNKNFGTTAGTVVEGNDSRINNGQTAFSWGNHAGLYPTLTGTGANGTWGINVSGSASSATNWGGISANFSIEAGVINFATVFEAGVAKYAGVTKFQSWLGLGTNAYTSTAFLPLSGGTLTGIVTAPTAPAGTNTTQIATTAFVQANSRPYKVYTALLSQSGTSAPVATVLENTLGGTVVWTRAGVGGYFATLSNAFTTNKTTVLITNGSTNGNYIHGAAVSTTNVNIIAPNDGQIDRATIEIRVYL